MHSRQNVCAHGVITASSGGSKHTGHSSHAAAPSPSRCRTQASITRAPCALGAPPPPMPPPALPQSAAAPAAPPPAVARWRATAQSTCSCPPATTRGMGDRTPAAAGAATARRRSLPTRGPAVGTSRTASRARVERGVEVGLGVGEEQTDEAVRARRERDDGRTVAVARHLRPSEHQRAERLLQNLQAVRPAHRRRPRRMRRGDAGELKEVEQRIELVGRVLHRRAAHHPPTLRP